MLFLRICPRHRREQHFFAEHGGAYWLLDEIAIIQPYNKAVAAEEFQVCKLAVRPDRSATLSCPEKSDARPIKSAHEERPAVPRSRGQNSNAASLGQSYLSSYSVGSTVTAKSLQLFSCIISRELAEFCQRKRSE
jgi:hypothetical protein